MLEVPKQTINVYPKEFWSDYEEKNGQQVLTDWVTWVKKGNVSMETTDKVSRIQKHNLALWQALKPHYEAWKAGESVVDGQTPLSSASFVTKAQVSKLRSMMINSVEDLAGMNDSDVTRFGMGGMDLRKKAIAFVQAKNNESAIAVAMAAKDKEIEALKESVAMLSQSVKEMKDDKPKRGRPAKEDEAA